MLDELEALCGTMTGVSSYTPGYWIAAQEAAFDGIPWHQTPDGTLFADERMLANMNYRSEPTYTGGREDGWQGHEPERIVGISWRVAMGAFGVLSMVALALFVNFWLELRRPVVPSHSEYADMGHEHNESVPHFDGRVGRHVRFVNGHQYVYYVRSVTSGTISASIE